MSLPIKIGMCKSRTITARAGTTTLSNVNTTFVTPNKGTLVPLTAVTVCVAGLISEAERLRRCANFSLIIVMEAPVSTRASNVNVFIKQETVKICLCFAGDIEEGSGFVVSDIDVGGDFSDVDVELTEEEGVEERGFSREEGIEEEKLFFSSD